MLCLREQQGVSDGQREPPPHLTCARTEGATAARKRSERRIDPAILCRDLVVRNADAGVTEDSATTYTLCGGRSVAGGLR